MSFPTTRSHEACRRAHRAVPGWHSMRSPPSRRRASRTPCQPSNTPLRPSRPPTRSRPTRRQARRTIPVRRSRAGRPRAGRTARAGKAPVRSTSAASAAISSTGTRPLITSTAIVSPSSHVMRARGSTVRCGLQRDRCGNGSLDGSIDCRPTSMLDAGQGYRARSIGGRGMRCVSQHVSIARTGAMARARRA